MIEVTEHISAKWKTKNVGSMYTNNIRVYLAIKMTKNEGLL